MELILPGAATLSEFIAGLNGDCGPLATLSALHEMDAARWPLSAAGLHALDADERALGFIEANGAQNTAALSNYLVHLGVRHQQYGGLSIDFQQFHDVVHANAGHNPIICEWANAQALPGDEPGVHFHYSTVLGISTDVLDGIGGYLCCDGDNRADDPAGAPRPPVTYTIENMQAAQPISAVVVLLPVNAPHSYTIAEGDTLSSIAARLHLSSWFTSLYQPNMATIEDAARAHGLSSSNGGAEIFPGTVLHYS